MINVDFLLNRDTAELAKKSWPAENFFLIGFGCRSVCRMNCNTLGWSGWTGILWRFWWNFYSRKQISVCGQDRRVTAVCTVKKVNEVYRASPAIWNHTVLPATRHRWTRPTLTPVRQAGTRFTFPGGMEGWVYLGVDHNYTKWYISLLTVTDPSSNNLIVTVSGVKSRPLTFPSQVQHHQSICNDFSVCAVDGCWPSVSYVQAAVTIFCSAVGRCTAHDVDAMEAAWFCLSASGPDADVNSCINCRWYWWWCFAG